MPEDLDDADWNPQYVAGCADFWITARIYLSRSASSKAWFDAIFESVRPKKDRIHVREQLIAECWGYADPC